MQNPNYTTRFTVDQTPEAVFAAINNLPAWYTHVDGETDKLGAVFYYHYQDTHRCTYKVTELVSGKKVVWHVLQNYFSFTKDPTEWTGTDVVFEIAKKGDQTEVHFTHVGLVPAYECYDACSSAWDQCVGSLRDFITTGKGHPIDAA